MVFMLIVGGDDVGHVVDVHFWLILIVDPYPLFADV